MDGIDFVDSGSKLPSGTIDAIERAMDGIRDGELSISPFISRVVAPDRTPLDSTDDRFDLAAGGNRLTVVGGFEMIRFDDDDGQLTGFGVELLDEAARRLGLSIDHRDA